MTWEAWVFVCLFVLGALVSIGTVGAYREPTTPSTVVFVVVVDFFLVLLAVRLGAR